MKNIFIGIVVIWILFTMAMCGMVKRKYVEERRAQYEIACSKLKKLMTFSVAILLLSSLTIVLWVPNFVVFLILIFASLTTISAVSAILEIEHAMKKLS